MNQRELKARIKNDPDLTGSEKAKKLREVAAPYRKLSDEELLQLVRDFVEMCIRDRQISEQDAVFD